MERKTKYIITDHFISKSEDERKENLLNYLISYINKNINSSDTDDGITFIHDLTGMS